MVQEDKLREYCNKVSLEYNIQDNILEIDGKKYEIVDEDYQLFNEEFEFYPILKDESLDGHVYEFGGRWYIHENSEELSMTELIYIGKCKQTIPTESFLGIHSGFELMNGIGTYKKWVQKAKFLGIKTLANCEKDTLGGVLDFQALCQKNEIKSIIGMSLTVKNDYSKFVLKLYARDFQGWLNLLKFNEIINVEGKLFVPIEFVKANSEGLFIIADPKTLKFNHLDFDVDFYQLDTVQYINPEIDSEYINNLEKFIKSDLEPISITDAYYLEQEDYKVRELLWSMNKSFDLKTNNQYFKNKDQYAKELIMLFEKGNNSWHPLFKKAIENEQLLVKSCNFVYDTDTRHLPKYIMTEDEAEKFDTNEELLIHIVKEGFKDKNIKEPEKYIERLKSEIEVLSKGEVIDYFLGIHDIIREAKRKGMLTGIGRGSAGGSLVAYLMGIVRLDPIEFDLIFERFLNPGRMGEFVERPAFEFEFEDGAKIELTEGTIVSVERQGKRKLVFVNEVQEGDNLIRY